MASRSGRAEIKVDFDLAVSNTMDDGDVASLEITTARKDSYSGGVDDTEIDRGFTAVYEISTTPTTVDVAALASTDLGAGTAKDGLGQTQDIAEIVVLKITNQSNSADAVTLDSTFTPEVEWWSGSMILLPGQTFMRYLRKGVEVGSGFTFTAVNTTGVSYLHVTALGRHDLDESSSSSSSSSDSSSSDSSSSSSSH